MLEGAQDKSLKVCMFRLNLMRLLIVDHLGHEKGNFTHCTLTCTEKETFDLELLEKGVSWEEKYPGRLFEHYQLYCAHHTYLNICM